MFFNYIKTAIRSLVRQRLYTVVNIVGMSVALTGILLIGLYVVDEYRFDRFHSKADRIYRVGTFYGDEGQEERTAAHAFMISQIFRDEFPEIEDVTRFGKIDNIVVSKGERVFNEDQVIFAEASLFNVFDYRLSEGNPVTALEDPFTVVLTRTAAQKYLGDGQGIGSTILVSGGDRFDKHTFTVTGIIEDLPLNTSFPFDIVLSGASDQRMIKRYYTFLLLKSGVSLEQLKLKFPRFEEMHLWGAFRVYLTPLKDIHFYSDVQDEYAVDRIGDQNQVYNFTLIAIFILIIACANFINLSTAGASSRNTEVGVRKFLGAGRTRLIVQYLVESIFITCIAFFIALVLGELVLPFFNVFADKDLDIPSWNTGYVAFYYITGSVVVGIMAGIYPAFYVTRLQPASFFRGKAGTPGGKGVFRRSLVTAQFVISVTLISCTVLVYQQTQYMRHKDLGFDKEHVIVIPYPHGQNLNIYSFVRDVGVRASVLSAGLTTSLPGGSQDYEEIEHFISEEDAASSNDRQREKDVYRLTVSQGDEALIDVLDLKLVAGRGFSADFPRDTSAVLINEKAAALLGFGDPVGQTLYYSSYWGAPGDWAITAVGLDIVGVVADYHFRSMHQEIQPLIIYHYDHLPNKKTSYAVIRLAPGDLHLALEELRTVWSEHIPERPLEYMFLDEQFDQVFRQDLQFGKTAGLFTALAIFIACLGLFALSVFSVACRTKEIGVRKVLGASAGDIVGMLYKETLTLILVSLLFAIPLAWYAIDQWLQNYVYRIRISPFTFLFVGMIALSFALITVSYQAIRAATSNPIDALRYE